MLILPLLGVVTANVDIAPFQPTPPDANCRLGIFLNNSIGGQTYFNTNGYYGLQMIYASLSPWGTTLPTSTTAIARPYQVAGCTINSFGVFNYVAELANVAQYRAVDTTYNGYASTYNVIQGPNKWTFVGINNAQLTVPLVTTDVYFPNILTSDMIDSQIKITAKETFWRGGTFTNENGPAFNVQVSVIDDFFGPAALFYPSGNSTLGNFLSFVGEGASGQNTPAVINFRGRPVNIWAPFNGESTGVMMSPKTGLGIFKRTGVSTPIKFINYAVPVSGTPFLIDSMRFSDPTDDLNFNPDSASVAAYVPVMCPGGGLLLRANNNAGYLYILSDFSGYFRLNFIPQNAETNTAVFGNPTAKSWGMDLDGNIWFGAAPTPSNGITKLYSNLNLQTVLTLPHLPTIQLNAVTCRMLFNLERTFEG